MAQNTALKVAFVEERRKQIEVAAEIGLDPTRLSKIVNGHIDATPEERKLIAKALGRSVLALFSVAA